MTTERRILLVNDNQNVLHLLKYSLEEQGMTVDCTTSTTDAVRMSMHHPYDAVVVPGDDAISRKLQQAGVPIVLISKGRADVEQLVAAIRGVVQYVVA